VGKPRKSLPPLGELELVVLQQLWQAGDADVSQMHAAVGKARGITPNTVGSALERLHRKGLLLRQKVSHAFRYAPSISRDEFAAQRMLDATGGVEALAQGGMLAAFVDLVAGVDEASLDRLEALIASKRDAQGKR
jgi:predicted transcriptional regulator